jgi:ubiquinone biosynthesis monooxygenase Coq7
LYQGQALTARSSKVRSAMQRAAAEEHDHLAWCEQRLSELDSHRSVFNPLWYAGSLTIGAVAGWIGDRWSLGFLAETERQVVRHLQSHLDRLPDGDDASRAILEQMRQDEARHAATALRAGAAELPAPVKHLMALMSKIMTTTAARW